MSKPRKQTPHEQAFWLAMVAVQTVNKMPGQDIHTVATAVSKAIALEDLIRRAEAGDAATERGGK